MAAKRKGRSASQKTRGTSSKKAGVAKRPTKAQPSHNGGKRKTPKGTAPLIYDARTGRWRRGGRYVEAPLASRVRRDAAGRPIDGRGRLVPAEAVRGEAKRLAKARRIREILKTPLPDYDAVQTPPYRPARPIRPVEPKEPKEPKAPITEIRRKRVLPQVRRRPARETIVEKELVSSSFENRRDPALADEILANTIAAHAAKGPFAAKDVPIYTWGIKLVGDTPLTPGMVSSLANMLPAGAILEHSDTKAGTEVYVRFNDAREPLLLGQIKKQYTDAVTNSAIVDIYHELSSYWDEMLDWYVWAEVEESLYE